MPTTRRSTRASTGVAAGKQSKLSFQHKVTKRISHPGKEEAKLPARTKAHIPDDQEEVASKKLKKEDEETVKPEEQEETDVKDEEEEQEEQEEEKSTLKTPFEEAEARAAKLNDREISKYWKEIEASRRAKELHKKHAEGLSTAEKVLRHFDVSSQYGVSSPCLS
jgi:DNA polymerase delta subunit 4